MRPKRSIFAVLVVLCLSACASENTPQSAEIGPDRADAFAAADNDQDDKLSQGEAGDFVVYKVFEVYDTDEDGLLTLAEWSRSNSGETSDFEKRDANRDGVVTLGEAIVYGRHSGGGASLMRKADKNRDGKLDRSEIQ